MIEKSTPKPFDRRIVWLTAVVVLLILFALVLFSTRGGGIVVPALLREQGEFFTVANVAPLAAPTIAASAPREAVLYDTTGAQSSQGAAQTDRLIVRAGVLTLVVDDPRNARIQVENLISEMVADGAFVVSSTEQASGGDKPPTVAMTVRVPVGRFDDSMNRIADLAKDVLVRSTTAQDVTEEYVDLQAKLQSMEVARDRLLQIMAEANTTKDLLEIEKQLTQRNAEIDSMKARLQYLEGTASLSSIQIEFRPSVASQTVIPGWHPDDTARKSLERLVQRFQNTVDWWIAFAIADLPWLLLYGAIIVVAVRFGLRWWRSRQTPAPISTEPPKEPPASD